MIRSVAEKPIDVLVADLIKHEKAQRLAVRRDDIPAANRYYDRVTPILDELVSRTPDGRVALETLLTNHSAFVRLSAAAKVLQWNPKRAIPVLAAILTEDLGQDYSPVERSDVRSSAKGLLYRHFDIRSFDPNDLVEPLKEYGVDFPPEDRGE